MSENVAFYAILTQAESVGDSATLKFDLVRTNIGKGYNCFTGIFRAPLSGCYVFNVSLVTNIDRSIEAQLVRNGETWMKMYAGGTTFYGSGANTAIMELEKDDRVSIQVNGKYHSEGVVLDGAHFCSFSGFLQN